MAGLGEMFTTTHAFGVDYWTERFYKTGFSVDNMMEVVRTSLSG